MRSLLIALALLAAAVMVAQTVDHPLNVGGEVKPPIAIYTPDTEYTKAMSKVRVNCPVVALIVDEQGIARDPHILRSSGSAGFDEAMVEGIADYRFRPARLRGTPVAVRLNMSVCIDRF